MKKWCSATEILSLTNALMMKSLEWTRKIPLSFMGVYLELLIKELLGEGIMMNAINEKIKKISS
jgi:hypothetical protein